MKFFFTILVATLATLPGSATAKTQCAPCNNGVATPTCYGDYVVGVRGSIKTCSVLCADNQKTACCDPGC
ncbi:hypothetical protein PTTW11_08403 [Pyrenophora teres f. teres]|uniref:Uncharacterized protein n=1 Tax=Pyrenophora teres f. teres TaxID=97479 RepID=A0A6S6W8W9_9PLEO|nr:hypothetical protein PTTW11_08403 [Pyrenophora teres f. teres]